MVLVLVVLVDSSRHRLRHRCARKSLRGCRRRRRAGSPFRIVLDMSKRSANPAQDFSDVHDFCPFSSRKPAWIDSADAHVVAFEDVCPKDAEEDLHFGFMVFATPEVRRYRQSSAEKAFKDGQEKGRCEVRR